jgi:hypothetical protein
MADEVRDNFQFVHQYDRCWECANKNVTGLTRGATYYFAVTAYNGTALSIITGFAL